MFSEIILILFAPSLSSLQTFPCITPLALFQVHGLLFSLVVVFICIYMCVCPYIVIYTYTNIHVYIFLQTRTHTVTHIQCSQSILTSMYVYIFRAAHLVK